MWARTWVYLSLFRQPDVLRIIGCINDASYVCPLLSVSIIMLASLPATWHHKHDRLELEAERHTRGPEQCRR